MSRDLTHPAYLSVVGVVSEASGDAARRARLRGTPSGRRMTLSEAATWIEVADALGATPHAAHKRYRDVKLDHTGRT